MKRFMVCNYYSASNRGDAAIAEGLIHQLNRIYSNPKITILTNHVEPAMCFHDAEIFYQPFLDGSIFQIRKFLFAVYLLIGAFFYKFKIVLPKFKDDFIEIILKQDIVIATGGSNIVDCYGFGPYGHLWFLLLSKMLKKKTIIVGQSIGPLNSLPLKIFGRFVLNRIDAVILRDDLSSRVLKEMGIKNRNIHVTADLAFLLEKNNSIFERLRFEECPALKEDNLNVSISLSCKFPGVSYAAHKAYIEKMREFVSWLIGEFDANVFFVSTCTNLFGFHHDDRILAINIYDKLKPQEQKKVKVFWGEYTPYELCGILQNMKIHIGSRMHSNILSSLVNTPFIAIGYEFKTMELLQKLNWSVFYQEIRTLDCNTLKNQFLDLLEKHDHYKRILSENVDLVKKISERSISYIDELVKEI